MKALTLYPEHAALFALGIRSIETRSKPTRYRGPLALHAGVRDPDCAAARRSPRSQAALDAIPHGRPLVLGAIVATCQLVDVVPITKNSIAPASGAFVIPYNDGVLGLARPGEATADFSITDQRPYGDFTPGRYAWLLDSIKPTTERCPACWGESVRCDCEEWRRASCEHRAKWCLTCEGKQVCDPIPARGRQGLWTWTP